MENGQAKLPIGHVRTLFVVQSVEYILAFSLGERWPSMNLGAGNNHTRRDIELLPTLPQLRQQQQAQQEGADHIGRDGRLVVLQNRPHLSRNPGILYQNI